MLSKSIVFHEVPITNTAWTLSKNIIWTEKIETFRSLYITVTLNFLFNSLKAEFQNKDKAIMYWLRSYHDNW